MEVKPGYKQTEVGMIPEAWGVIALGERATFKTGPFGSALHKSDYVVNGIPWINPIHIVDGNLVPDSRVTVTEDAARMLSAFRLRHNDIIIARRGDMGRCALVRASHDGWICGSGSMIIRCAPDLDSEFVQRVLTSPRAIADIENASVGSTMNNLNQGVLERLKIQCPPTLAEQRAIAAALSDTDDLITGLERVIAKKRAVKQAAMQQLLTGKTRLTGFQAQWTTFNLAEHSTLKARIGWQGLTTAEYLASGEFYLITGTDFEEGKVKWSTCHFVAEERYNQDKHIQVRIEDVLMTKDGTIGKVAYVDSMPANATLNSGVFVIRPKPGTYHPHYLYYVLTSDIFGRFLRQLQAGSTISHLYQKDFVGFSFPAPALSEQHAIAAVLSDIDAEIATLEQKRDKTRAIKQGMMQELLTGRIRLV